jgi:hypothetical protein
MDPYAVVRDIAASWATYLPGNLGGRGEGAPGLLLHAAGVTDDGYRIIDVWESEDAWVRHRDSTDERAFGELASPPVVRGLHVRHIVIGTPAAGSPQPRRDHDE